MNFVIVHELRGTFSDGTVTCTGRMRCRSGARLALEEAEALADAVASIDGVVGVSVNPFIGSVLFYYQDDDSRLGALKEIARCADEFSAARKLPDFHGSDLSYPKAEGPMAAAMEIITHYVTRPFIPWWYSIPSAIIHAVPYLWKGIKDLLQGKLHVSVLDAAAITVCLLRRDFRTCRTLTLLLGIGDALESWTRQKSLASLSDSLDISADTVWVRLEDGTEQQIPMKSLQVNDVVVVNAGSNIPVDGVVVEGEGVVNQSAMTGEPIGVVRTVGHSVFAGTVMEEGTIFVRVTKVGDETRLKQIVNFIEESETLKAGIQGRFERMADMAVPFTFGLAGLVWLLTRDPIRASSVLLVDYSCALKLTTPLTVLAAMREGALNNVVIKGGRYLEALKDVDTVVFDKTGTLTNATPRVANVVPAPGFEADAVLRDMACLEEHFPHPVARAVVRAAEERNLGHPEEHDKVQYIVAHGVCSELRGKKVVVGSRHYVENDEGIDLSPLADAIERETSMGRSLLYVGEGGVIAGLVSIEDPPRPEAAAVIQALRESGVERILMITGDDERTAKAIAARLGITEYRAQVLPTDKSDVVQSLLDEGRHVLMVGDGINDAPALSAATVGVAMTDGTDLAQGVANVLLTKSSLEGLITARTLGTRAMQRISSNYLYTMLFNSLFLAGGIFMILTPGISALLHNMTTVLLSVRAMKRNLPETADAQAEI
ncbi:MAG: heavy metal translocating P-type ATPase [Desulfovibrionaceae bacterium]|nr:heavy metal translocating P-type ATPase [Desulfovibrionaceae bacterium]